MGCDGRDRRHGVNGPGIRGRRLFAVRIAVGRAHVQGVGAIHQRTGGVGRSARVAGIAGPPRPQRCPVIEPALIRHGIRSIREREIAGGELGVARWMGFEGGEHAATEEDAGCASIGQTGMASSGTVGWKLRQSSISHLW